MVVVHGSLLHSDSATECLKGEDLEKQKKAEEITNEDQWGQENEEVPMKYSQSSED